MFRLFSRLQIFSNGNFTKRITNVKPIYLIRQANSQFSSLNDNGKHHGSQTDINDQNESDKDKNEEDIRYEILEKSLRYVNELGWNEESIEQGCIELGLSSAAIGMFPRGGVEIVEHFYEDSNQKMKNYLENLPENINKSKYTILQNAIKMRLELISPFLDNWPQAMALMALPQNVKNSLGNLHSLSDEICFHMGNRSTNITWYCERLSVAGIYKTTEFSLIQDKSEHYEDTWAFLNRRISDLKCIDQASSQVKDRSIGLCNLMKAGIIVTQNMIGVRR